jgi:acyl-coenzyme A synthetase/AMP-(fatty) acid ligase
VQEKLSRHKWLDGGVEFVEEIPKSTSGKILRRVLKEKHAIEGKVASKL